MIMLKRIIIGIFLLGLVICGAYLVNLIYKIEQYINECENRGINGFAVKEAETSQTSGLSFSPPQFSSGHGFLAQSIEINQMALHNSLLAHFLLENKRPSVRASTAYLLVSSDQNLDENTLDIIKKLVVDDPDLRIRYTILAAFDDPFEFTPPHLILYLTEFQEILKVKDKLSFQLLAYLIGKGRCKVVCKNKEEVRIICDVFLQKLNDTDPANRLLSYEALTKILSKPELGAEIIKKENPDIAYFKGAAFSFWLTADEQSRQKVKEIINQEVSK